MKNLMTAVPCMAILLALLLEFVQVQIIFSRLVSAEAAIENFRQAVRTEGCVSAEQKEKLAQKLGHITGCGEEEVRIEGSETRVKRPGTIRFLVSFPVRHVLAAPAFWKIPDGKNRFRYRLERSCVSEYLPDTERKHTEDEESDHDNQHTAVRYNHAEYGNPDGTGAAVSPASGRGSG